jgi:cytochrome c biogenesis protein
MKKSEDTVKVKESSFPSIIYDLFRSLKLTISLLILLAILSIIGTLITQNATRAEYIQRYGPALYEVLNFFNLFDMYHSWWFSAILLLLVINLITCSIHRLPGILSQISRESGELEDRMLKTIPYVERIQIPNPAKSEENIRSSLTKWFKKRGRIETEKAITLFSQKGRYSRLGVPITHLSILIILIGGIIGSLYGFRGHVEILEGETVNEIFLRTKDEEKSKPIDFSIRCDDFNITYYDLPGRNEKHVKEYTSIITVLENGKEILKKTVQVNHPLHYKGLAFYQSNYGAILDVALGIQWKGRKEKTIFRVIEGSTVPVPNTNNIIRVLKYAHDVHNFGEGVQVVLFKPKQEPKPFWLFKNLPQLDQKRGDEFALTFEGFTEKEYTGLSVTKDPGVWVVWIGCGLMIVGLIVSFFFSHQRVWVRISKTRGEEIVVAGSTNKNRVGFEKSFGELVEGIREIGKQ